MLLRRLAFFTILLLTAAGMTVLVWRALEPGGWTVVKALIVACFLGVAPWLGVCAGNGVLGFLVLVLARRPARCVLPVRGDIDGQAISARTALLVTVRNEDLSEVLPPLGQLMAGLDPAQFTACILSDTQDALLVAREAAAIAACGFAPRYRRRLENSGFKAGNVMEFLDHHAEGFEFAVVLDADSRMSAEAVRRLVRIMQAAPGMGIVQHLTAGLPAAAAFPRLFQFGTRAGMRVWAVGQAVWQGDCGPYWGHNAILRIAPFRAHARLAPLPDGSVILSHDQVEAAQLSAAGWGVCVWADDDGSYEANPPALPEFLRRDARWQAGNLQYRHLLVRPGFRAMGRWQLLQAILLFSGAPLYVAMFVLAVLAACTAPAGYPRDRLTVLAVAWLLVIYAPKLLGYVETLAFTERKGRYGGAVQFLAGAAMEFLFSLLLDAPSLVSKTLALGVPGRWLPQNRGDRGVGWGEAVRLFWPHTLFGVVGFAVLAWVAPAIIFWALPFAGGLLVSIPFCVVTAAPGFSLWLRQRGIAAMPEERLS